MDDKYITREEFNNLGQKVEGLDTRLTKTETRTDHLEKKLDKIENNTTWILRLILGAIILAILGYVLQSPETNITLGGYLHGK